MSGRRPVLTADASAAGLRSTGIDAVGDLPWGTHFCHFFETRQDLLDILIPYFKAGLAAREHCLWVAFEPVGVAEAHEHLRRAVPGYERHLAAGDIEILPHTAWYFVGDAMDLDAVVAGWKEKLAQALARGCSGLRANGNTGWLPDGAWGSFLEYERKLNDAIADQPIILLCTYPLSRMRSAEMFDVALVHECAVARRHGRWQKLETPELKQAKAKIQKLNLRLERRVARRTRELAAKNRALRAEVAERRRVEAALRESTERLSLALEAAHMGTFDWDIARDRVVWSHWSEALWGYAPAEFHGTYAEVTARVHPEDLPGIDAGLERCRAARERWSREFRVVWPDGSVHWIEAQGEFEFDAGGEARRMRGTVLEITERKRTEALLHAREREYRTILENTPDSIVRYDRDLRRIYVNPALLSAYAVPHAALLGRPAGTFPPGSGIDLPADELRAFLHSIRTVFATGQPREHELAWSRPAERRIFSIRLAPEFDADGAVASVLAVGREITALKSTEEALRRTQAELARVARLTMMGELAASIAHEVNQPLAAVVTNASACLRWLAAAPPNLAEAAGAVRRIARDGNRASAVIARIRSLLRKGEPVRAPVDVNDVVRDILALARLELLQHQVELQTELAHDLPRVAADRVQLQQVVLNLVMNAIDALGAVPDRARTLHVRTRRREPGVVCVAIEDNGVGIAPGQAEHLFEAFYTTKPNGLGMGLFIGRSIVEAHGGRLWATAGPGHGFTVQFTLPVEAGATA